MLLVNFCNIKFRENPLICSGVVYTGGGGIGERQTKYMSLLTRKNEWLVSGNLCDRLVCS